MKPLPLTLRVKVELPATALGGVSETIEGSGLAALIVNVIALEVPPPGAGLKTVTLALPGLPMSPAGTDAVSWVALT